MNYRPLGSTGLEVSELGFGGIPIQRLSEEDAVDVVRHAFHSGITFFDTAAGYSTSEERIGRGLEGVRHRCVVATKTGAADYEGCKEHLMQSLERLRTDYIDVFQFHGVNTPERYRQVMSGLGAYKFAKKALAKGFIHHIGFSSHNLEVALEMVRSGMFETVQFPFNLIGASAAETLFPEALSRGMGVIVMKPFGGGAITSARSAFAFLRQYPDYLPIPGIEKASEIDELAAIYNSPNEVTPETTAVWEKMRADLGHYFCRRCGYCGPCPQGVEIITLMTIDTLIKRFPVDRLMSEEWVASGMSSLDKCADCARCEAQCPFELSIRDKMRANREHYLTWRESVAPKA